MALTMTGMLGSTQAFLDESLMLPRELSLAVAEWIMRYEVSDLRAHLVNVNSLEGTIRDVGVSLVNRIFAGDPPPDPYECGNAHCSGAVDIDDVVRLIQYMCTGGNAPGNMDGDGVLDCRSSSGTSFHGESGI
jgi:hypothetical protein